MKPLLIFLLFCMIASSKMPDDWRPYAGKTDTIPYVKRWNWMSMDTLSNSVALTADGKIEIEGDTVKALTYLFNMAAKRCECEIIPSFYRKGKLVYKSSGGSSGWYISGDAIGNATYFKYNGKKIKTDSIQLYAKPKY